MQSFLKSHFLGQTLLYSGSTLFLQLARFGVFLVAAKLLGPETYGLWMALWLVIAYGINAHLGVLNGLNREVPFARGRGQPDRASAIRRVSFTTAVVTGGMASVAVLIAVWIGPFDAATRSGLVPVALLLWLHELYLFFEFAFKSEDQFHKASLQQTIWGVLSLALIVPGTAVFGFSGFLWSQVATLLATLAWAATRSRFDLGFLWDKSLAITLARIGFPIMLVGLTFSLFTTVDRLIILRFLGREALGFYSMAILAGSFLMLLPRAMSQVTYPKMAHAYGEHLTYNALRPWLARTLVSMGLGMLPLLVVVYLLAPWGISRFFSEYIPGIPAVRISIVGVYFLGLIIGFANFLNVVNRQGWYLAIQLVALTANAGLGYAFVRRGWGITGVALATALAYSLYAMLMMGCTAFLLRRGRRSEGELVQPTFEMTGPSKGFTPLDRYRRVMVVDDNYSGGLTLPKDARITVVCEDRDRVRVTGHERLMEFDEFIPRDVTPRLAEAEKEIQQRWYERIFDDEAAFRGVPLDRVMRYLFFTRVLEEPLKTLLMVSHALDTLQPEVVVLRSCSSARRYVFQQVCARRGLPCLELRRSGQRRLTQFVGSLFTVGLSAVLVYKFVFFYLPLLFRWRKRTAGPAPNLKLGAREPSSHLILFVTYDRRQLFAPVRDVIFELKRSGSLEPFVLFLPTNKPSRRQVDRGELERAGVDYARSFSLLRARDFWPIARATWRIAPQLQRKALAWPLSYDGINLMPTAALGWMYFTTLELMFALEHIEIGKRLVGSSKPRKVVFTLATCAKSGALNEVFKSYGIETLHVQHGQVQDVFRLRTAVTKNLVWGDFEKRLLERYSDDGAVISGFYPKGEQALKADTIANSSRNPIRVLLITNPIAARYRRRFIKTVLEALGDLEVPVEATVKVHPAESTQDYKRLIGEIKPGFSLAITKENLMGHLARAHVIVALYSSVVVEALFFRPYGRTSARKPVLVYELPINDPCTLYGQIDARRLFKTAAELKEKLGAITEALSQGEIDTSPEERLFAVYFGEGFKPKRLIEAIGHE